MIIKSKIRFAEPSDMEQLVQLCEAHAHFEKSDYDSKGKATQLQGAIFASEPKLYCLVVESDGVLIGYATYMVQYSTWDAAPYIYMDCLYLKELARGLRIGEKLVRHIQKEGQKLGCNLVQWQTPDFNVRAIKFYKRLGASSKSKERFYLEV